MRAAFRCVPARGTDGSLEPVRAVAGGDGPFRAARYAALPGGPALALRPLRWPVGDV